MGIIRRNKICFILSILALGVIIFTAKGYLIVINKSDSLPFKWALIQKGELPLKKGDIFAFWTDGGGFYKEKTIFVKILSSNPGSLIEVHDRGIDVDGVFIGNINKHSSSGKRINVIKQRLVRRGQYFASATHPRSFDSRYNEIGLINEKDIIGTAVFIF